MRVADALVPGLRRRLIRRDGRGRIRVAKLRTAKEHRLAFLVLTERRTGTAAAVIGGANDVRCQGGAMRELLAAMQALCPPRRLTFVDGGIRRLSAGSGRSRLVYAGT